MTCRLLHSVPRGLRQATHPPWAGNGSQQSRRQEENIRTGPGAAPLSNDAQASDTRQAQPLYSSKGLNGLVQSRDRDWKWQDGWSSFACKRQWHSFRGKKSNYTSHDALEWGSALLFSLHLCRVFTAATLPDDSSGGKKKILASVAARLTGLWHRPTVASLNLLGQQEGAGRKAEVTEPKHETQSPDLTPTSPLAVAVARLQAVTDQSLGQAHNSLGMKRAREGRLEQAAGYFLEGSKAGFGRATFNLAVSYEQGRGVAQDLEKAADLYKTASSQGHPLANYNLGVFHLMGTGGVRQDTALALELIGSAAAAGVTQANRYLGIHFLDNPELKDAEKAATFLQKAVDKQDTAAQYHLGLCYEHGWGVPVNSAKAASLYHVAAHKGHPEALYSLARFHELGLGGLPINREQALLFYKHASEAGHQQASDHLEQLQCDPTADTKSIQTHSHTTEQKASFTDSETPKIPQSGGQSMVNNKALHLSISAPSLRRDDRGKEVTIPPKDSTNQQLTYMNGKFSISHLSLLLPYYLSLPSRPSLMGPTTSSGGQRSKVSFQVGGDDEKIEEGKVDEGVHSYGNGFHVPTPWLTVS